MLSCLISEAKQGQEWLVIGWGKHIVFNSDIRTEERLKTNLDRTLKVENKKNIKNYEDVQYKERAEINNTENKVQCNSKQG